MPLHSPLYAIPYLIVFMLLCFLYLNETRKIKNGLSQKSSANVAFVVMFLFLGIRGHIYSDFVNYYAFFRDLPPITSLNEEYKNLFEPGFIIYTSLIKTIVPSYYVWITINTLIDLLIFRIVFKRYTHSQILPFIFFMAYQGLIIEFNLYQNSKAIALFLLSLPYLERRKIVPYLVLNFVGATFHISAIIFLPLYFFIHKEFPRSLVWGIVVISNIIFWSNFHFTSYLLEHLGKFTNEDFLIRLLLYENKKEDFGFSFGYFERTISILICIIYSKKLAKQNPVNIVFCNAALIYYSTFMLFSDVRVFTERIPLLFIFSFWLLFTNLSILKFKYRPTILAFVIIISFLKVSVANQNIMCYYDNHLWGIKTYEERKSNVIKFYYNK